MNDTDHDELLERLARVAGQIDAPPPEVVAAARAAFTWRTVDAELAELAYDSWLESRPLAGVRAVRGTRRLVFDADELQVELEVDTGVTAPVQLIGQVVPPRPGTIEVRNAERCVSVAVDRLGRFALERLPAGPISLRCQCDGVPTVETAWVVPG